MQKTRYRIWILGQKVADCLMWRLLLAVLAISSAKWKAIPCLHSAASAYVVPVPTNMRRIATALYRQEVEEKKLFYRILVQ